MIFTTKCFETARNLYPQFLAAFAVWIIAAEIGVMCTWCSPYLARLTVDDSPLPLTLTEASWVASLLYLGRLSGAILGSMSFNFYGSRKTTLMSALPIALGWLLTYYADSPSWLYVARISLGAGFGFAYSCFSLYLGEIAMPEIRGSLVSFAMMGCPVGNLLAAVTGSYMSLGTSSLTYLVPCIFLVILLSSLPDSPHHLVKLGRMDDAKRSMQFYRGSEKVDAELEEVTQFVKASSSTSFPSNLGEFRLRHVYRATILVMTLFTFTQLSGLNNVLFYMQIILKRSKSDVVQPSSAVTSVLTCAVITATLSIGIYDRFGRRVLLIISSLGVSIALTCLGTHFVLLDEAIEWIGSQWLPLVSLVLFITSYNGLNSVSNVVSSEVYATNIKPIAACLANLTAAGAAFCSSKFYQPLVDLYGEAFVFYLHAFITLLAVPYALLFMTETKGKTLQQIQYDLSKK